VTTTQPPGRFPTAIKEDPQILVEEMACMIAEAQAALFAGRYQDVEVCAGRLRKLCEHLKSSSPGGPDRKWVSGDAALLTIARRVQHENKVFSAVLRRVRHHLDALRNVLNGPSLSYRPSPPALPERKI
jgi:hypothetical protein